MRLCVEITRLETYLRELVHEVEVEVVWKIMMSHMDGIGVKS